MTTTTTNDGSPLGLAAGSGDLPRQLIASCRQVGQPIYVIALKGHCEPETVRNVDHAWVRLGAIGQMQRAISQSGLNRLCMAGKVKKPSLLTLLPDWEMMKFILRFGFRSLGDNALLEAVRQRLAEEGVQLVGAHEIIADLLIPSGPLTALKPDSSAQADIAVGLIAAQQIGRADIGQAVIVRGGTVIAREGVDGTDAMLDRVRRETVGRSIPSGVLVKIKKPDQDQRLDPPVIGVQTLERAAEAGLAGIAVEARGTLVADRKAVEKAAERLGLFVVGVPVTVAASGSDAAPG
ncbi:MAG: UDP-2,3-diacylglucosamine diphosphatase LpxI [Pseudomonadota bacterium]